MSIVGGRREGIARIAQLLCQSPAGQRDVSDAEWNAAFGKTADEDEATGFGMATLRHEGQMQAFDEAVTRTREINAACILNPALRPALVKIPAWRNRIAATLVSVAEWIGDQQFYGRDK